MRLYGRGREENLRTITFPTFSFVRIDQCGKRTISNEYSTFRKSSPQSSYYTNRRTRKTSWDSSADRITILSGSSEPLAHLIQVGIHHLPRDEQRDNQDEQQANQSFAGMNGFLFVVRTLPVGGSLISMLDWKTSETVLGLKQQMIYHLISFHLNRPHFFSANLMQ